MKSLFYDLYLLCLVNYNYDFSNGFLEVYLITVTIFLVIVMLNLMISIIGGSYEKFQEKN